MGRYLIDVFDKDKVWIKQAAKQLDWKTAEVVQLAISKLREEKWDKIKAELEKRKMAEDLERIRGQREALQQKEKELEEQLTVTH